MSMENQFFDFIGQYMPLTDEEKQVIIDLRIFKTFKKETVILKVGDRSKVGYFVVKGCLRSYYIIDGAERTTAFYTEMESFTPPSTITNKPSEYYVECVEDCILTVGNPEMEKMVFKKFPRFETLCRIMSEVLLAKHQASFDDFKTSTPEQRYLKLVEARPDLLQRVPQHQLASYLGIQPQSLSRIRKRLANREQNA